MTCFACPVCHHRGLTKPPYERWPPPTDVPLTPPYAVLLGEPSYEVCPRCGYEFGNDDDPGEGATPSSFEEYRAEWISDGRPWFDPLERFK